MEGGVILAVDSTAFGFPSLLTLCLSALNVPTV
jgi:hypothetical protein